MRELARLYVHVSKLFKKTRTTTRKVRRTIRSRRRARRRRRSSTPATRRTSRCGSSSCPRAWRCCARSTSASASRSIRHARRELLQPDAAGRGRRHAGEGDRRREQGRGGDPEREGDRPRTEEEQQKEEPPAIIRKRDGAFTYTTTDLATIKHRVGDVEAGRDAVRRRTSARRCTSRRCSRRPAAGATRVSISSTRSSARCWARTEAVRRPQRRCDRVDATCSTTPRELGLQKYEASTAARTRCGHKVSEADRRSRRARSRRWSASAR